MTGQTKHCTLSKDERLHGKKDISRLLSKGRFRMCRNFRYCFLENNGLPYSRIMVSVSKRFFKRAVKRNLLKRRIRESYRLQKDVLPDGKGADILFIYNSKEVTDSRTVSAAVRQILTDIGNEIRKK